MGSVAKAHRFKDTIQAPLSGQTLTFAFVLLVSIKPNNLFGLMLYMIHKTKIGRIGIRRSDIDFGVNIPVPPFKLREPGLAT